MITSPKSVSIVRTIGHGSTEQEQYNIDWEREMMAIGVETVEVTSSPRLYTPRLILHQFRVPGNGHLANTYRTRGNISAFQPPPWLLEHLALLQLCLTLVFWKTWVVLARLLTRALRMALGWKVHSTLIASLSKVPLPEAMVVTGRGLFFGGVWLALPAF